MKQVLKLLLLSFFVFVPPALGQSDARKFADVGEIPCDDVKGHLDHLSVELQGNLGAKAYIVTYGGRTHLNNVWSRRLRDYEMRRLLPKRGEAEARVSFWKSYLINTGRVEGSRVEVIGGGYREEPIVEVWIVPPGAKPPPLTPTLKKGEIKFRPGRVKWKEMFGESCA